MEFLFWAIFLLGDGGLTKSTFEDASIGMIRGLEKSDYVTGCIMLGILQFSTMVRAVVYLLQRHNLLAYCIIAALVLVNIVVVKAVKRKFPKKWHNNVVYATSTIAVLAAVILGIIY